MAVIAGVLWTGVVPMSMSSPPALVLSLSGTLSPSLSMIV